MIFYYNKETGKAETESEIRSEFKELKANTNEFNRISFEGFLRKYYRKRPYPPNRRKK